MKPKSRLGYNGANEIKDHPYFASINWIEIANKRIEPPYKPRISGDLDLRNIDRVITYISKK
jgi:hypothetical protein